MRQIRWPSTLLMLAIAVALLSVVAFLEIISLTAEIFLIGALVLFFVVFIFGRRGV